MVGWNVECQLPSMDDAIIDNCRAAWQQAQVISPCSLSDFPFGKRRPLRLDKFPRFDPACMMFCTAQYEFPHSAECVSLSTSLAGGIGALCQFIFPFVQQRPIHGTCSEVGHVLILFQSVDRCL